MKILILPKLKVYIRDREWPKEMYDLIGKTFEAEKRLGISGKSDSIRGYTLEMNGWFIPVDCAAEMDDKTVKIKWYKKGKLEEKLITKFKTFEQYHELDPYGEEEWEEGGYKIVKYFAMQKNFQNGQRYYIMFGDNMIIDFDTIEEDKIIPRYFLENLHELNLDDKEKLISGEYVITNGYIPSSDKFRKITYNELKKRIEVKL